MQRTVLALAVSSIFFTHATLANDRLDEAKTYIEKNTIQVKKWIQPEKQPQHISFQELFPKPIYKKSYFGFALTGALVVVNGAVLFFTAGSGAPAAYAGTSALATWIGGGGAGSYMAGLSTIGGWFGGNAILGAALLNGISAGVVGGSAVKFTTLTALQKAGVLASVTATGLDGVALIENPETKSLNYRVRLMTPLGIGSKEVQGFTSEMQEIDEKLLAADKENDKAEFELWAKKKQALIDNVKKWVEEARKSSTVSGNDLIVYGVFSKNIGDPNWYKTLISRVRTGEKANAGYLDYLHAVAEIETGNLKQAERLLYRSVNQNSYAIEPYVLLVNLLGRNFKTRADDIQTLAKKAKNDFDSDKYESPYSLVSLYYRLGALYLQHGKYEMARQHFESAEGQFSMLQKYLGGKQIISLIQVGKANALYGLNRKKEADSLYQKVIKESETVGQVDLFRGQYVGAT